MNDDDDRWLWDRAGEPDPVVERLEGLMAPLALPEGTRVPEAPPSRPSPWLPLGVLAALAGAVALVLALVDRGGGADGPRLYDEAGRALAPDSTFVATAERRRLTIGEGGEYGDLELTVGSRLRVARLGADETVLALDHGGLDAFVTARAHPGFFNVDTPSTRCVDLGCQYTLVVEDDGRAHVRVKLGRVAFRDTKRGREREVFVPHGAECWADPGRGAGTPRYLLGPRAQVLALDRYDALPEDAVAARREAAAEVVAGVEDERDLLPVWHLLQDPDPEVVALARGRLVEDYGELEPDAGGPRSAAADRAAWRERLWPDPYR
ncbi:MAG: hypothetical protein R3F30_06245 [Planctomycetota bacterium]